MAARHKPGLSRGRTVKRTGGAVVLAGYPTACAIRCQVVRPVITGVTRLLLPGKSKRATLISNHTRTWGNVGLVSATFSVRGRDARYHRRLPLRPAAL
jgi:hypothetical protein